MPRPDSKIMNQAVTDVNIKRAKHANIQTETPKEPLKMVSNVVRLANEPAAEEARPVIKKAVKAGLSAAERKQKIAELKIALKVAAEPLIKHLEVVKAVEKNRDGLVKAHAVVVKTHERGLKVIDKELAAHAKVTAKFEAAHAKAKAKIEQDIAALQAPTA